MYIALKLPLKPNKSQESLFKQYAGTARWVYNWSIQQCKEARELGLNRPSAYEMQKKMTLVKKETSTAWLSDVSKHIPDKAIEAADTAFKNFFRRCKKGEGKPGKKGFPKFKKRGKSKDSFSFNVCILATIKGRFAVIPKIGKVRISRRYFEVPVGGKAKRMTVSRVADKWFVSILYEVPDAPFVSNGKPTAGVDLGLTTYATISSESITEKIENPRPYRKALLKLKRQNRRLHRKVLGSKNREKQRCIVAKTHAKIANVRRSFLHGLTARLAKNHGKITIERLTIGNMVKNHRLALSIFDAGWSEFRRQLEYKCHRYGSELVIADKFFPSSKTCNKCGKVVDFLPLSTRHWTCECGAEHDRDENAAINLDKLGQNMPEVTPVEIGDQASRKASRCRSRKREISAPNCP